MSDPKLPEGLKEMSKQEEPLDPKEVEETYNEIYEEITAMDMDRRSFLSVFAGGGGLAVLNGLFAQKKYMGDDVQSGLKEIVDKSDGPIGVVKVSGPTYEVDDDRFHRHSGATDFDFYGEIARWIHEEGGTIPTESELLEAGLHTAGSSYSKDLRFNEPVEGMSKGSVRATQSLFFALSSLNELTQPHSFGRTNDRLDIQKLVVDGDRFMPRHLVDREPDIEDPELLRNLIQKVGRLAGAGDVGVAELDKRWFYTHRGDDAPIEFEAREKPVLNDERTVIPEKMDRVVVGVTEMPFQLMTTSPSKGASAGAAQAYGRMGVESTTVATWIRSMGYNAIPSKNDTSISVPQAIDAGLGEGGRHGRLVTPQFGGNVRIWKVFTDMPLTVDPYIKFGVSEYCESCRICYDNCPSNALTNRQNKTWESKSPPPDSWKAVTDAPWDSTKANGVKKWYQNPKKCLRYWQEKGGRDCNNCIIACPFTHGRDWLQKIFRYFDPPYKASTQFSYSGTTNVKQVELQEPESVWREDYAPFGLSQDSAMD